MIIKSIVDQPINVRLVLVDPSGQFPEFLQSAEPEEYTSLAPNASNNTQIKIAVSENAQPGNYFIGIKGELQENIIDRANVTQMFSLTVIAK